MDSSNDRRTLDFLRGNTPAAIQKEVQEYWFNNFPTVQQQSVCPSAADHHHAHVFVSPQCATYLLTPGFPVEVKLRMLYCIHCGQYIYAEAPPWANVFNLDNRLLVHAAVYASYSDSLGGRTTNNKVMFSSSFKSLLSTYKRWGVDEAVCAEIEKHSALFSKVCSATRMCDSH